MATRTLRRPPPMRTFGLETAEDVQAFREALVQRRYLPRVRIALRASRLTAMESSVNERRINELLQDQGNLESCIGALVLAVVSLGVHLWAAGGFGGNDTATWWMAQLPVALTVGAIAGRLVGLRLARQRLQALCVQLEQRLTRPPRQ